LLALGLAAAPPAAAQQPDAPPADPLAPLRDLGSLTDEQRRTVRAWIDERIEAITGKDEKLHAQAFAELRAAAAGGKAAFRDAFVAASIDAVREPYKTAERAAAARLIVHLAALNEPTTVPVLVEALRHEEAAVRTAAAVGLRTLRGKLATAGGAAFTDAVSAMREAGKRETSLEALSAICDALNYSQVGTPPDARANTAAILEILEARAALYAAGKIELQTAEVAALRTAAGLTKSMNDEERRRLIIAVATILRHSTVVYAREYSKVKDGASSRHLIELRNSAEPVIEDAEKLLVELVRPPSGFKLITDAMKKGDDTNMRAAMSAWSDLLEKAVNQRFDVDAEDAGPRTP
jgi:hypothetical protein